MEYFVPCWCVIYTKPKFEKRIAERLAECEIEYFLPLIKVFKKWHDRIKHVETPLFPSYIFVYLKNRDDYFNSSNIPGVCYFLKSDKQLVRVKGDLIKDIRTVILNGTEIEVTQDFFQPGQIMNIKSGPFAGLTCELVERNMKKKALVRIKMLQQNLLIAMPFESLTPKLVNNNFKYCGSN
jgi:transcriptional antiterminator RfaH